MENLVILFLLLLLTAGIIAYLIRGKRRGQKCVGCPYAKECGSKCKGSCTE